jgi:co-chaperonin GroES (HSP10)
MPRQHVDKIITDEENNSIFLPSQSQDNEEYLTAHGIILSVGDLAYSDRQTGAAWKGKWPSIGDHVTYGKYAGQKVTINGVKLLLLNDDEITSVIPDGVEITSYIE